MLCNLYIENIAVIQQADIDFSGGLTVLSGETGAGKSIIIDALSAILGGRTSRELIRTGQSKACVAATFAQLSDEVVALLAEMGFEAVEFTDLHKDSWDEQAEYAAPISSTCTVHYCRIVLCNNNLLCLTKHVRSCTLKTESSFL